MTKINITERFSRFTEHWRPKVVARLNGQELKLVKLKGEFVWHRHDDADELFLVWRGNLRIEFRDQTVTLGPGECYVVPRGTEHRTAADEEAEIVVFEPSDTRNTGNVIDPSLTAPQGDTI